MVVFEYYKILTIRPTVRKSPVAHLLHAAPLFNAHLRLLLLLLLLLLLQDMPMLGLQPSLISYASDYFQVMIETATQLIVQGFLYADDTPSEQVRFRVLGFRVLGFRVGSSRKTLDLSSLNLIT